MASGSVGSTRPRMDDGERLHVERGRVLGGIGQLHDRQRMVVAIEQQERLVPLAAQIAGADCVDVERSPGDIDDLGRIKVGADRWLRTGSMVSAW